MDAYRTMAFSGENQLNEREIRVLTTAKDILTEPKLRAEYDAKIDLWSTGPAQQLPTDKEYWDEYIKERNRYQATVEMSETGTPVASSPPQTSGRTNTPRPNPPTPTPTGATASSRVQSGTSQGLATTEASASSPNEVVYHTESRVRKRKALGVTFYTMVEEVSIPTVNGVPLSSPNFGRARRVDPSLRLTNGEPAPARRASQ
jgi:hypothetical protein